MVSFSSKRILLSLLLFVIFVACSGVYAQLSLECEKVWKEPSAKNDIFKCVKNIEILKRNWRHLILPALNLLLLVVFLLTFPFAFVCVTMGGCCIPTSTRSSRRAQCCVWVWIFYVFVWAAVMFTLVFFGAGLLLKTVPAIFDSFSTGSLSYFNHTAEKILDYASDWSTGERKKLKQIKFDFAVFDTFGVVHKKANDILGMLRTYYLKYLDMVTIATYCVASVGFAFCLLFLPSAICRLCVPCLPLVLSCLYWITGIIFAILGIVVSLFSLAATLGCGEVELHYKRQPGVLQWFGVPMCMEKFKFENLNREVEKAQGGLCNMACGFLLQACSESASKGGADATKILSNLKSQVGLQRIPLQMASQDGLPGDLGDLAGGLGAFPGGLPAGLPGDLANKLPGDILGAVSGGDLQKSGNAEDILKAVNQFGGKGGISDALSSSQLGDLAGALGGELSKGFEGLPAEVRGGLNGDLAEIIKNAAKNPEKLSEMFPDIKHLLGSGGINSLGDLMKKLSTPLTCGKNITKAEDCSDFGTMAAVLMDSRIRNNQLKPCGDENVKDCSLSYCAVNCKIDVLKYLSKEILMKAELARNASIALSYARPLLECNFIMEKFAAVFDSCTQLRAATLYLSLGFLVGGLLFGLAIYIALRGASVWKKRNFQ